MKIRKNMNTLAKDITELEGNKIDLSIAQIKETLKCMAEILAKDEEYLKVWERYVARKMKK